MMMSKKNNYEHIKSSLLVKLKLKLKFKLTVRNFTLSLFEEHLITTG